jgi:hypothetical protein
MPRAVDTLERSPTELQRMVRLYLPPSWCLVAVGITTSIVDIVHDRFHGSQVIVVDWSPDRTRFLHNTLQSVYTTDMHILRPVPVDRSVGPSTGEGTGSAELQVTTFRSAVLRRRSMTKRWGRSNEMKSKSRKKEWRMTTQGPRLKSGSQRMRVRIPRMRTRRRRRRTHQRMNKH